ncbi:MAG TPA: MFS transporter [Candidatus Dormibacteraeota bacterium]|nr:MFS transporter [Candidatus Dormibacteraeota bacterium]
MRVQGFPRLVISMLLGRVAGAMLAVAFVLFVLTRYHSPQLAGTATFLLLFPGIVISPLAGALLDRYGRTRLITVDYFVATTGLFLMASLSAQRSLPSSLLLLICGLTSLTVPLSAAGVRSMFPTVVPGQLWERANAIDNSSHVLSHVVGAPLAGVLVGFAGPEWALAVTASLFACAGLAMLRVHDPSVKRREAGVLTEAWSGLTYVFRNRTLVGLALTFFATGIGWGILTIAIPVLVLGPLHQGPAVVGYLQGGVAVAGFAASLVAGRLNTLGRERHLMVASIVAWALAMCVLPFASSVLVVAAAMVAIAILETPFDIAFLTLRQRRTDPARFGRAFAVSMSLNIAGLPVGSALAGALIAWSLNGAMWVAVAITLGGAIFPIFVIPDADEPAAEAASRAGRSA